MDFPKSYFRRSLVLVAVFMTFFFTFFNLTFYIILHLIQTKLSLLQQFPLPVERPNISVSLDLLFVKL